eukprot:CAMPEP_0118688980 /NCGR_PEP_ID=MMETSP0800-20121206/9219_1 /TAXON_ID=210618 ORGANISM="Striatella unipunctata, Strain CCMP2910" /NCGR_SAMPLE_ID=MMETSP0800 /ASSEMBLY_ACC=CAM_ASM_000638 /LENGTH=122 /DNA_ID=CAMNT_0006586295 /DNA_START=43 /DNA_END=411 /DNA_ORIENTATION=+
MTSLQLATKARSLNVANPVARLYRSIVKELPRVLMIYDIDTPLSEARDSVRQQFQKNSHIQDPRVLNMLLEKGYMDLEEILLQHAQRPHLIRKLNGGNLEYLESTRFRLSPKSSEQDFFNRD